MGWASVPFSRPVFCEPKLRPVTSRRKFLGLSKSPNRLIAAAAGDFAARPQADDGGDVSVRVFSSSTELLSEMRESWLGKPSPYPAMYSSVFGGITLDPATMVIPIDDHMVHRGHGVFDTAIIFEGFLYGLDEHLARFMKSAEGARIRSPFSKAVMRSILIQLTAVSKCRNGTLRYWLSAGPGDFLLSPAGCPTSAFYAIVIAEDFSQSGDGVRVVTSTIPMKPPLFATMKNVNYLPNALSVMEAEEKGACASIWVDENGYVAEGPNMNVAFITNKKELILPSFHNILSGCTALRLIQLSKKLVDQGCLKDVETRNITVDEAKASAEMMFIGSGLPILPIIEWDEKPIGNGDVGEVTMLLSDLLWQDMVDGPEALRIAVPYSAF